VVFAVCQLPSLYSFAVNGTYVDLFIRLSGRVLFVWLSNYGLKIGWVIKPTIHKKTKKKVEHQKLELCPWCVDNLRFLSERLHIHMCLLNPFTQLCMFDYWKGVESPNDLREQNWMNLRKILSHMRTTCQTLKCVANLSSPMLRKLSVDLPWKHLLFPFQLMCSGTIEHINLLLWNFCCYRNGCTWAGHKVEKSMQYVSV